MLWCSLALCQEAGGWGTWAVLTRGGFASLKNKHKCDFFGAPLRLSRKLVVGHRPVLTAGVRPRFPAEGRFTRLIQPILEQYKVVRYHGDILEEQES